MVSSRTDIARNGGRGDTKRKSAVFQPRLSSRIADDDEYLIRLDPRVAKHPAPPRIGLARATFQWMVPMKNTTRLTVTVIALLSGVSIAAAADHGMSGSKSTTTGSASSLSQPMAKDSLSLTSSQRKIAWKDISGQAAKEKAPAGFTAKFGAAIPGTLTTQPVPVSTANKVPALRPYQYALLDSNKLLIVNPSDKKVAEVISQ
jgi:hypothetical protein